jgi:hypothetical protein
LTPAIAPTRLADAPLSTHVNDAMNAIGDWPRWPDPASAGWSAAALADARA